MRKHPQILSKVGLFFLLLLTILVCDDFPYILIAQAQSGELSPPYLTQWGSSGEGDGQFWGPTGVAVDSSGYIYVADTFNYRIQRFDRNGVYLTQWGSEGSGNGQFAGPTSIAFDSSGYIYIADSGNSRIQKFDRNGTYFAQWGSDGNGDGQFHPAASVAVDNSDYVYVVDAFNYRIQKFDSSGSYLAQWGSFGSGDGQFLDPTSVAVDSHNDVYVVDSGNHRIQKFDSNGVYLTQWGSLGNGNGQFNAPSIVTVDSGGNVYVTDTNNHRIQKFDRNGAYYTQWGAFGSGNGQFMNPIGVAVDSDGYVYIADTSNQRIQKFGPSIPPSTIIPTATPTLTHSPTATPQPTNTPTTTPTSVPNVTPTATLPASDAQISLLPDQGVATPLTTSIGSQLQIEIAAGTVDQPTTLLLNLIDAPQRLPEALYFAGHTFSLDAYQQGDAVANFTFQQPITLTIIYTDADIAGLSETTLMLYYYDTATNRWRSDGIIPMERVLAENRLRVTINHLTDFALFSMANTSTDTKVQTYLPLVTRSHWKVRTARADSEQRYCAARYCLTSEHLGTP